MLSPGELGASSVRKTMVIHMCATPHPLLFVFKMYFLLKYVYGWCVYVRVLAYACVSRCMCVRVYACMCVLVHVCMRMCVFKCGFPKRSEMSDPLELKVQVLVGPWCTRNPHGSSVRTVCALSLSLYVAACFQFFRVGIWESNCWKILLTHAWVLSGCCTVFQDGCIFTKSYQWWLSFSFPYLLMWQHKVSPSSLDFRHPGSLVKWFLTGLLLFVFSLANGFLHLSKLSLGKCPIVNFPNGGDLPFYYAQVFQHVMMMIMVMMVIVI